MIFYILINILVKFGLVIRIDDMSALVQGMAWRRTGAKPLPGVMMSRFTEAYVRYQD